MKITILKFIYFSLLVLIIVYSIISNFITNITGNFPWWHYLFFIVYLFLSVLIFFAFKQKIWAFWILSAWLLISFFVQLWIILSVDFASHLSLLTGVVENFLIGVVLILGFFIIKNFTKNMSNKMVKNLLISVLLLVLVFDLFLALGTWLAENQTEQDRNQDQTGIEEKKSIGTLENNFVGAPENIYREEEAGNIDNEEIISSLTQKVLAIDSYAQDIVIDGQFIKRMSFKFAKNGKPFFMMRSKYTMGGKKFIDLFNIDGQYNYEYYPDDNIAFRVEKGPDEWDESSYGRAKETLLVYFGGAKVIGEDVVDGKECYVLDFGQSRSCLWKDKGIALNLMAEDGGYMEFKNIEFNLSDDLFTLPEGVKIIDK